MSEDRGFSRPDWFGRAAALLTGGTAVTAGGIRLWEDPVSFVIASVAGWIVDGLLSIAQSIGATILLVSTQIIGATVSAGAAVADAIGVVGGSVLALLGVIDTVIIDVAGSLGPFSFVGVIGGWMIAGVIVALSIRALVEVVRFI